MVTKPALVGESIAQRLHSGLAAPGTRRVQIVPEILGEFGEKPQSCGESGVGVALEQRVAQGGGHLHILGLRPEDSDGVLLNRVPVGLVRFDAVHARHLEAHGEVLLVIRGIDTTGLTARNRVLAQVENGAFIKLRHQLLPWFERPFNERHAHAPSGSAPTRVRAGPANRRDRDVQPTEAQNPDWRKNPSPLAGSDSHPTRWEAHSGQAAGATPPTNSIQVSGADSEDSFASSLASSPSRLSTPDRSSRYGSVPA